MNTTNFFVELIVIGLGAAIAILFVIYPLFDKNMLQAFNQFYSSSGNGILALIAIPIVYLIGILVDRVADFCLKRNEKRIQETYFEDNMAVRDARTLVFSNSERLSNLLDYNRSRLRICRGWFLNGFLLLIGVNVVIWFKLEERTLLYSIILSLGLILFTILNYKVWKSLTHKEFEKLKSYSVSILKSK